MTPNGLHQEEAAAREVIAALGRLSRDVQVPPDFFAHVLAKADQQPLPRQRPPAWTILRAADGEWRAVGAEGMRVKRLCLHRTGNRLTALVRLPARARYTAPHPAAVFWSLRQHFWEELYLLEGDLVVAGQRLHAGDYATAAADTIHRGAWSEAGCTFLLQAGEREAVAGEQTPDSPSAAVVVVRAAEGLWSGDDRVGVALKAFLPDPVQGARMALVRMQAGACLSRPRPLTSAQLYVLEGHVHVDGLELGPGDYAQAVELMGRTVASTEGGCLCLLMATGLERLGTHVGRRGFEAREPRRETAAAPEVRAAYRDLQTALAHPQWRPAVLTALRAFAHAAETGITVPHTGVGSTPAAAGAVDAHSPPPPSDAIEPVPRLQALPAVRAELMGTIPIVSQSPKMQEVSRRIERVLQTTATVLITGERGTGKKLIARIIHERGSRRQGPFMVVGCAAIPETRLEAELFSRLEMAAGGTLFVDGIAEMRPTLQAKFLRVLQEGRFERVGSPETLPADTRIIAAATPELERLIAKGEFRRDLFSRLNVYTIPLPPLRERKEDIIPLARHFLSRSRQALQKDVVGLSEDVRARLLGYAWPGNVNELQTVMEEAVGQCQGTVVTIEDLPPALRAPGG
jgi:hypothetical protein